MLALLLLHELHVQAELQSQLDASLKRNARELELLDYESRSFNLTDLRRDYAQDRRNRFMDSVRRRDLLEKRELSITRLWKRDRMIEEVGWTQGQQDDLERETADVWPEWWGNVDVVGRSPYDHIPSAHIGERRRILFLTCTCRFAVSLGDYWLTRDQLIRITWKE